MTPWQRRLRRARLWLIRLLALGAILMAVLVALTQLALPWVTSHPEKIAAMLSERLHRPVTIDSVEAHWERNGPLFRLAGLHLGAPVAMASAATSANAAAQTLTVANLDVKVNFFAWVKRNASWTEFRIAGVELDLVRDAAGKWQLRGMDTSGNDATSAKNDADQNDDNPLFNLGTVVLRNARLNIDDLPNDKHFKLGADELRLINKGEMHRVLARVKNLETDSAPVNGVFEYNSDDHTGRAYLGGSDVDLAAVLRNYPIRGLTISRGGGRIQVWAWTSNGEVSQARVEVDLANLVLTTRTSIALDTPRDILPHVGIERLKFGARWQRESDGWTADLVDLSVMRQGIGAEPAQVHLRRQVETADAPPEFTASVQALDLSTFASASMLVDALPPGLRRWLYLGNPEGELTGATLRYVDAQDYDVAARISAIGWRAVDKIPGATGLSGVLHGDQDALNFDLPQHNDVAIFVPHVFRQPLEFAELSGSVAAYRTENAWRMESDALRFEGATPGKSYGGELRGAAEIPDDQSRPSLELYALIDHADVQASHLFWPINTMSPNAVAWLDRALDGGRIVGGRSAFRGNLADWPFRNNAGRFDATAEIDDLRFKYLGDWPAAEHGHANAEFINAGLHAEVDSGSVQGNKINKASVDISDYGEGTLDVDVSGQGSGRELLGFIKATPLGTKFADQLQGVDIGGQGKVDLHVHAPMKPIENFTLDGTAALTNADLSDSKYNLHFDDASGPLRFNRSGFSADQLATTFHDKPAKFSFAVGGYVADVRHAVEARVDTKLPVRDVLAYAPALNDYQKYTSGEAQWSALFSADRDDAENRGSGQRISLTSDLRGVALDLAAPLAKTADTALPLKLVLTLPFIGADLDLHLGDIVSMRARLPTPTTSFAANVEFGGEAPATLPKSGMVVGGSARVIDLSGWTEFASDDSTGSDNAGGGMLERVDLRTPSLTAWDRSFGEGAVKLTTTTDAIQVAFDGANIQGNVTVPRKDLRQRGITADLQRLYWPAAPELEPGAVEPDDAKSPFDPATIPPVHIRIGDFHLGAANYGQANMESTPVADGMHFDQVSTHSSNIDMRAHGDWTRKNGYHRSTFGIDLSAQNIGNMLGALGSPGLIDGGQTVAHIDASWAGPPSAFAINKINGGALKVSIAEGRVPDIQVGAGRIAGLLNLAAIPRRLAFDFGDLFNKGYSFDSIAGTFTLSDGYAYTENLEVKSPTADMRLKGSMGLKTRDWDQIVEVTPHVGGTLALGGALIGGPVGAVGGAVLQTVFKNQINAVTRVDYKVSGSWDKPSIVKVASVNVAPKKPAAVPNANKPKSDAAQGR